MRETLWRVAAQVSNTQLHVIALFTAGYNHAMNVTRLDITTRASHVGLSHIWRELLSQRQRLRSNLGAA